LLAPVDRVAIYFGKVGANLAFLGIVVAVILPVYSILYNVNLFVPGLLGVIVLGSIGYVAVGTLLAAMAVQARTRDLLLPILLFPVVLPVLIPAVRASTAILQGVPLEEVEIWIRLLIVYDVVFLVVAWWVFDYVVEE
jgi:heme exporter protein B